MNRAAESYGKVLFSMGMSNAVVESTKQLLKENPLLLDALTNPAITKEEKHRVIEKTVPREMQAFVKALCGSRAMDELETVWRTYEAYHSEKEGTVEVVLRYAKEPAAEQMEAIKKKIAERYKKDSVKLSGQQDDALIGGFLIRIGDEEYDYSIKGRLEQLQRKLAWR